MQICTQICECLHCIQLYLFYPVMTSVYIRTLKLNMQICTQICECLHGVQLYLFYPVMASVYIRTLKLVMKTGASHVPIK